jgi:glycine betaine catabolism B
VTNPPASEPEPAYEVKVDGNNILIKKEGGNNKSKSSSQFELTLLEKDKIECTDVMSFKFSKQDPEQKKELDYIAGQYAFFDIGGVYNDPRGPIRHFTISSSPTENFIMISTRIRDTPYKKRLSTLENGTKVKVRGPEGQFVLHQDYSKSAVFLSGGIGVTPFRSMIKYATDKQLPLKIVMFDSNRNRENILFKREFDNWATVNKNLKVIYSISDDEQQRSSSAANDWKGEYGRIDKAMILKYLDTNMLNNSIFYICGPPSMLKAMQSLLQDNLEIPKERIKVEEFTGY